MVGPLAQKPCTTEKQCQDQNCLSWWAQSQKAVMGSSYSEVSLVSLARKLSSSAKNRIICFGEEIRGTEVIERKL
jgi:hypothetical protein